jgi:hypothetical protein
MMLVLATVVVSSVHAPAFAEHAHDAAPGHELLLETGEHSHTRPLTGDDASGIHHHHCPQAVVEADSASLPAVPQLRAQRMFGVSVPLVSRATAPPLEPPAA